MLRAPRLALILIVASTIQRPARADEVDDWIETGLQLRRKREDAHALEYFRRAYEARPTPRTRVQLALAEQALGRWIEAEADLSQALDARGDAWIDQHRDKLSDGLETIRDHLGWIHVESQEGVELWLNGARVGVLPMGDVRVVASTVQVELRGRDLLERRQSVEVKPKETVHMIVPLVPIFKGTDSQRPRPDDPPLSRDASRPAPTSARRSVGWVALGTGGLLLVEAGVAEIVREQALAHYNDDAVCLQPGLSREQVCGYHRGRAETAQLFATVGFAAGGVAVGAGLWLLLTSPTTAPPVTVSVAPGSYGLSWSGSL